MSASTTFTVAMAQMKVEWGAAERNLAHAADMIDGGAAQGCALVLLPECLDIGWSNPDANRLARPIPGPASEVLAKAAKRSGAWVVAGLTERSGDRVYNSAVLMGPDGTVLLKHRKVNILEIAQSCYHIGDRLGVAQTPFGTLGVDICADHFPDTLVFAHSLARMGARAILSPCSWAVPADHDNETDPYGRLWRESYGKIAHLFDIPVVGVSNVGPIEGGPWAGRRCIGCSLAMGRDGRVLAVGPYGADAEALIPVELDLSELPVKGTAITGWLRGRGWQAT